MPRTLTSPSDALRVTQSGDSAPNCAHPHPRSFLFTPCNASPILPQGLFIIAFPSHVTPNEAHSHPVIRNAPILSSQTPLPCHSERSYSVIPNTVRNLKALTTTALASPQRSSDPPPRSGSQSKNPEFSPLTDQTFVLIMMQLISTIVRSHKVRSPTD